MRIRFIILFFTIITISFVIRGQNSNYSDLAIQYGLNSKEMEEVDILNVISTHLSDSGSFKKALELRKEYLSALEAKYGKDSPILIKELAVLSVFARDAGDNETAIECAKRQEKLAYDIKGSQEEVEENLYYYSLLHLLSIIQHYEAPIPGINYLLDCYRNHKNVMDAEEKNHVLNAIWAISRENNLKDSWIAVYKERALNGDLHEQLTNLINLYVEDENIQNDVNAPKYSKQLYDLMMEDNLEEYFSFDDITILYYTLLQYYSKINLIEEWFNSAKKNYEWIKQNDLEMGYSDLSLIIAASQIDEEAKFLITIGNEILNSHKYDDDPGSLAIIYENISKAFMKLGEPEKAQKYMVLLSNNDDFKSIFSTASFYFSKKDWPLLLETSLKLICHPSLEESYRSLILGWIMIAGRITKNKLALTDYSPVYLENYRNQLLNNIPLMSEKEQTKYLNFQQNINPATNDFFMWIEDGKLSEALPKEAYNSALLNKGILLTSLNEFREIIKNSQDTDIQAKWAFLQTQNAEYNLQNELITRELVNYAIKNSSYLNKLTYTWENVRDALKEDEAAIEFVLCSNLFDLKPDEDKSFDSKLVALIIRKDFSEPIPIALCTPFGFNLNEADFYLNDGMNLHYFMIWQPLEKYLKGIKTIYFSPEKFLSSFPIEYVSTGEQRVCDKWNLIRVSSTREIINKQKSNLENIVLYGGLTYNMKKDSLISESQSFKESLLTKKIRALPQSLRAGVDDLPGTLEEVNEISKFFPKTAKVITGKSGTEESFKALQDSSIDILHLATHGFFWTKEDVEKHNNVNFIKENDVSSMSMQDYSMLRSGLLFSGVNVGLRGDSLPEDVEDGVLTALELSSMNLGKVDLVVMSACESALGEITGEGVFGLQRGFKLAGANSLLMSLWKVDDDATRLLMTNFYHNLKSGQTKQQALINAQNAIREDGYVNPKEWAAFILLDGLN